MRLRPLLSILLSFALIPTGLATLASGQDPAPAKISIDIIEGDGAVNNIKQRTAREPIVQVTDENHKPIAGALVLFTAPDNGAGALFNGARTLSVTTNAQGRAVAQGFQTNGVKGNFQIKVHASFNNNNADASIKQSNARPIVVGAKFVWIVIVVSALAVTAGLIRINTGGSSTGPTVITPGSPTVGAPH